MKRALIGFILILLLLSANSLAEEALPARYVSILNTYNAQNTEELYEHLLDYLNKIHPEENGWYTPRHCPLNIRFGGTTQELIADQKNWDLAIVSSKDVDLQALVDKGLIRHTSNSPDGHIELHQWLLPEALQARVPYDRIWTNHIFVYDYDPQANDATLLICQANIGRKQNNPRMPYDFALGIMNARSASNARGVEGLSRVEHWTEAELLASPEDWDAATIIIDDDDRLEELDQAGLLFDFSQNAYFPSRSAIRPYGRYGKSYHELPNGIFSADGRMIGIPCVELGPSTYDDGKVGVLLLNAKSDYLERAQNYAVHLMKSKDWNWDAETRNEGGVKGIYLYKDEVDW